MTTPNQARLDRLFERIAPAYDLQLLLERRALKAAARLAGPLGGLRVLDLATGTGALAAAMLDRLDPPAELVAVDRSPAMLARAGKRLAHFEGRSRISVTLADAGRLPYTAGHFDLVASAYFLHPLEREDAAAALEGSGFVVRGASRTALGYWSQTLLCERA